MRTIYNKTTRKKLCEDCEVLDTVSARARGLMFRAAIEKPLLFVFDGGRERRAGLCAIHSLFVFVPFSAIYLDAKKRVIEAHECAPFFSFVTPKKDAAYLVEGEQELARKVKKGDVLEFELGIEKKKAGVKKEERVGKDGKKV